MLLSLILLQVHMFERVFRDMKHFLGLLLVILLGFSLCFYVELKHHPDSTNSFNSYLHSFFSTFIMMLGEKDVTGSLNIAIRSLLLNVSRMAVCSRW